MTVFSYEGVTITLKPATMRNRLPLSILRELAGYWDIENAQQQLEVDQTLNLLYLVEKVDGDLGFPVPCNGDATEETVKAFVDAMLDAPEDLYLLWANAVHKSRQGTQLDRDLLPPNELTERQKKDPTSKKSD